ncbi:hypothetical protein GCM10010522_07050 [Kribbella solani]
MAGYQTFRSSRRPTVKNNWPRDNTGPSRVPRDYLMTPASWTSCPPRNALLTLGKQALTTRPILPAHPTPEPPKPPEIHLPSPWSYPFVGTWRLRWERVKMGAT